MTDFGFSNHSVNTENFFHDWNTHVGDNSDYTKNTVCPGGPFMTVANDSPLANDPSDVKAAESGWVYDPFPGLDVWRYGTERPCNLEGQYITFEADYS